MYVNLIKTLFSVGSGGVKMIQLKVRPLSKFPLGREDYGSEGEMEGGE